MKRTVALSFMFFVAICCITFSCKQKENVETILTRLLHNWKLTKIATDDNGNGAIDASEVHPVANGSDEEIVFNKDNTGLQTVTATNGATNTYRFTWSLDKYDTVTRVGVGNNLVKYHIQSISSGSLELITLTDQNILAAYYYERK